MLKEVLLLVLAVALLVTGLYFLDVLGSEEGELTGFSVKEQESNEGNLLTGGAIVESGQETTQEQEEEPVPNQGSGQQPLRTKEQFDVSVKITE